MVKSGTNGAPIGLIITNVPPLLLVFDSPLNGNTLMVMVGVVPTKIGCGVTIKLSVTFHPTGTPEVLGFVQVTVCPLVVQVHAPFVNVAGIVIPTGNTIVVVNGVVMDVPPILLMVIKIVDAWPTIKIGVGCEIITVASGDG